MNEDINQIPAAGEVLAKKPGMRRTILIALAAVAVLVAVGIGAYAYMNNPVSATTGTPPNDAAQQFFTERGNGTPGVFTNTVGYGDGPSLSGRIPGVVGTVEKVDGNTITVKNPMDGTTQTIQTGPKTVVHKQADVKLSDITPGTKLNAIGQKTNGVLMADLIQVGGEGATAGGPLGSAPMQIQINPGDGGGMAGGPADGNKIAMPDQVTGTVETVDGNTITLTTADGPATVQVSASTQLNQQVTADVSAIVVGDMVVAQGTQSGAVFDATDINISSGGMTMIRNP